MSEIFRPESSEQLCDVLQWAAAGDTTLEVVGSASKLSLGRPVAADNRLDLSKFAGISMYEPDELVLSAGPGTPLSDINAALAEHRQRLDFEPPDYGPVLAAAEGEGNPSNTTGGSLGGVIACNLSGPRRVKAGAARDHFLGFHGVSGRGETFKSGGRVVKNVTGYDLSKLIAGSWGTLAVMTEVTIKVLPVAEKTRTLLLSGVDAARGVAALTRALQSPYDVSAAAWLPANLAARSAVDLVGAQRGAVAAVRVEGPGPSVEYRCDALRRDLEDLGATEELHSANSSRFWLEVRDVMPFATAGDDRAVWRLSVPPSAAPEIVGKFANEEDADAFLDWGGGLVWLALPVGEDARCGAVREAVARTGGHATLFRAPAAVRESIDVFQPQTDARSTLTKRIKSAFDPKGILNPGRMYADI